MEHQSGLDLSIVGYDVIEPGIRELVRAINTFGITTQSSHEGHIGAGEHEGGPVPWVALALHEAEAVPLLRLMRHVGEWRVQSGAAWVFKPRFVADPNVKHAVYLYLQPWEENEAEDGDVLVRHQREAQWLAEYVLGAAGDDSPAAP